MSCFFLPDILDQKWSISFTESSVTYLTLVPKELRYLRTGTLWKNNIGKQLVGTSNKTLFWWSSKNQTATVVNDWLFKHKWCNEPTETKRNWSWEGENPPKPKHESTVGVQNAQSSQVSITNYHGIEYLGIDISPPLPFCSPGWRRRRRNAVARFEPRGPSDRKSDVPLMQYETQAKMREPDILVGYFYLSLEVFRSSADSSLYNSYVLSRHLR